MSRKGTPAPDTDPTARARPRRRYTPRLPREQRADQILDAALRLIAREGFAALTMDRVATEADIAKSVLYAIFETPEGLEHALLKREQQRAFDVAAATVAELGNAEDVATGAGLALMRFLDGVAEHPDGWRLVLMPPSGVPPSVRDAILDGRERWRREIEPIAQRLLARAGLEGLDPELVAHLARGNAEYAARLMLEDPDRYTRERLLTFAAQAATRIANLSIANTRT